MKYLFVIPFLCCFPFLSAASIEDVEVKAYIPETYPVPNHMSKIKPFEIKKNDEKEKAVFVFISGQIQFAEDEEKFTLTYEDLALKTSSGELKPVASSTEDGRVKNIRTLSRTKLEATKKRNNIHVNLGAVFFADPESSMSLKLLGKDYKVKAKKVERLPDAKLLDIQIKESEILDEYTFKSRDFQSVSQGKNSYLKPSVGKILALSLELSANKGNSLNGYNTLVMRPNDFHIRHKEQVILLRGSAGFSNVQESTIYNIMVKDKNNKNRFASRPTKLKLLYFVDPSIKTWKLYYGNDFVADIKVK